jgi:hypothetical protein
MTWGFCWPDVEVHEDDRDAIADLPTAVRLLDLVGREGRWARVRHGTRQVRVPFASFQPVTRPPRWDVGAAVEERARPERRCIVWDIAWHYKRKEPVYYLEVDGKRNKKRYYLEEELSSAAPQP